MAASGAGLGLKGDSVLGGTGGDGHGTGSNVRGGQIGTDEERVSEADTSNSIGIHGSANTNADRITNKKIVGSPGGALSGVDFDSGIRNGVATTKDGKIRKLGRGKGVAKMSCRSGKNRLVGRKTNEGAKKEND